MWLPSHNGIGWSRAAGAADRHVGLVALVLGVMRVALIPGLARLGFSSSQDTMVDPASDVYRTSVRYQERFGGEVMILLFEGNVVYLATAEYRAELDGLEVDLARAGVTTPSCTPVAGLDYAADQIELASVIGGDPFVRMRADSDEHESEARRELDNVVDSVDTTGLATPVEPVLRCGRPAEWLLREAHDADLVVGQKGLAACAPNTSRPASVAGQPG